MSVTLAFTSCGTIQVPVDVKDEPLYFIKGDPRVPASFPKYAVQMHFFTPGQVQLTKEDYDPITQGQVCMPLSAFRDINTEIGKLCTQVPCNYPVVQQVRATLKTLVKLGN